MKKYLFAVIILFTCNLFAQYTAPATQTVILIQGFNNGALNGSGSSTLLNKAENIYSLNPSALNNFNTISFGCHIKPGRK